MPNCVLYLTLISDVNMIRDHYYIKSAAASQCSCHFFMQVLHPGIRRQVEIDLILMKAGSMLISCLPGLKWLSLPEVVDEFEKLMIKQVVLPFSRYSYKLSFYTPPLFIFIYFLWLQIDLRFEARNMEKFKNNFKDLEYVKFPTPLRPFVTRTVLVETYEVSAFCVMYISRCLVCD